MKSDKLKRPILRLCGSCVCRNAMGETDEYGDCPYFGTLRRNDDVACDNWFSLTQLRKPLYGKSKNSLF